ncbi:MAG TPA: phosphate acyltransferase, partial [Clostridia bacterium]|nr:phosphate acyltransferase [Clostridia bacterium]
LTDCLVEGPISFDLAFSREAAKIKAFDSPVAGDADIFLVPDFVSGNLLAKSLVYGGGASFAGFLMGARSPVILTSRSASIEEKIHSIACGALMSEQ